jgi:hypothetical protein
MPDKMPHDIRLPDTKGTPSVLVDHELSGVIVGQTLATAPEAYGALLEVTAFGTPASSSSPSSRRVSRCASSSSQAVCIAEAHREADRETRSRGMIGHGAVP